MSVKNTTILTADDDPQLLRLMTRNLQLEGYEVLAASDGQQALEQIEQRSPDLVLLDVMMPKLDGFTVCHRVREFSSVPSSSSPRVDRTRTKCAASIWARTTI
jgi:DNA-binding response OmpR family regulator